MHLSENIDTAFLFSQAKAEIGEEEFKSHYRKVFGVPVLDFVDTIVINLPSSCLANCEGCIDKSLRKLKSVSEEEFIRICNSTFKEFPRIKRIIITGGRISADNFNELCSLIKEKYPDSFVTWNTNGILVDEKYGTDKIDFINLHRFSANDKENKEGFRTNIDPIPLDRARELFRKKLWLRIMVAKDFVLSDWIPLGLPLSLNRFLPPTEDTDKAFYEIYHLLTGERVNISTEVHRRNVYKDAQFNGIPIRLNFGDTAATRVSGRQSIYLNVCIIHRGGQVCGSWFEDDKLLKDFKGEVG